MELLEKVAERGGRLLQVDASAPASIDGSSESAAPTVLLTFDVARILVSARPGRSLELRQLQSREEAGSLLVAASEDEPWWRVIGNPLVRAHHEEGEGGGTRALSLQFRPDDQNPRFVSLRLDGGLVRARIESR